MLEKLESLPDDRVFIYINLFNVSQEATLKDLKEIFSKFDIDEIIPNRSIFSMYDLKLKSRETFKEIISVQRFFVCGKPFYMRFSDLKRQSK